MSSLEKRLKLQLAKKKDQFLTIICVIYLLQYVTIKVLYICTWNYTKLMKILTLFNSLMVNDKKNTFLIIFKKLRTIFICKEIFFYSSSHFYFFPTYQYFGWNWTFSNKKSSKTKVIILTRHHYLIVPERVYILVILFYSNL